MADYQTDTRPSGGNGRLWILGILLVLSLGANFYIYSKYANTQSKTQEQSQQINTDSVRLADLDNQYKQSLVTIESYKGQNAHLDSIISVKEKQLMSAKSQIDQERKQNKISTQQYQDQLDNMKGVVNDLQTQVTQLTQEKNILITKNDSLGKTLANQMTTNQQLSSTNQTLSKKVSVASLLKPSSISATGVRAKGSGKETETDNAKKVEKIKVCFNVPENDVADPGQKTFMVRIISPEGVTLALESSGSGTFPLADSASVTRQYTMQTTIDYNKQAQNVCSYWQQTAPYATGQYTAEVYQDGYMIGTTNFKLK
jgi:hypothetical protein